MLNTEHALKLQSSEARDTFKSICVNAVLQLNPLMLSAHYRQKEESFQEEEVVQYHIPLISPSLSKQLKRLLVIAGFVLMTFPKPL